MLEKNVLDLSVYRMEKAKELADQSEWMLKGNYIDGSINRSYYAIFSAVRSLLALLKLDRSTHSGVIGLFDRYFVKTGIFDKKWSSIAHAAFDARQRSDYEYNPPLTEKQAQKQLAETREFVAEMGFIRSQLIREELALPQVMK